jgi:hypothetical protein
MTTHLYCVLPHEEHAAVPPGLSGLAGAAVRALPVDGMVAWVSDIERGVPVSVDGVRAHDAVVEAALETGSTPVPARFGQRFDNDDACVAAIVSRAASVESLLDDLQGHVEMTLIVTPTTRRMINDLEPLMPEMVDTGMPGVGRAYLDSLRKREMATGAVRGAIDTLARRLMEAVASIAPRVAIHDTSTPMPLRTISHLVLRRDVAAYRSALAALDGDGQSRFMLIGPRAPYSFSALTDGGSVHGMKLAD